MGYLFLFISVISGSVKGFFAKKISDKTPGIEGAILTNFIRMIFCIPIGLIFILIDGSISDLAVSGDVLLIAAFTGITTGIFIVSWLLAVKQSAFTAVDTFIALGILVPIFLSSLVYQESVSASQIIGLILLIGAVMIMSAYNNQIKEKLSLPALILLLLVSLSNGLTDFAYKIFSYSATSTPASVFNFYIYLFSAATLICAFALIRLKQGEQKNEENSATNLIDRKKALYIFIMAIFLFSNSYFKTLATNRLSAVEVYPLMQGTAIILTLAMSCIFFKEKIKPLCILGLALLFTSLLFINVISF